MRNKAINARLIALAILTGCLPMLVTCEVENPRALFVYDIMAVTPRQDCVIQPGQVAQQVMTMGIFDVMLANSYYMFPRFKNMMSESLVLSGESVSSGQTEVNFLSIKGAKVWLDLGDQLADLNLTDAQINEWVIDGVQNTVSAAAEPEQEGAVGVEAIKAALGNKLGELFAKNPDASFAMDINAYVMLQAENMAGEIIYSNEIGFPIKVCFGCLVTPTASDEINDPPCFPGQDFPVPAALCTAVANYPQYCPVY